MPSVSSPITPHHTITFLLSVAFLIVVTVGSMGCEEPAEPASTSAESPAESKRAPRPHLEQLRTRIDRMHGEVDASIALHAPDIKMPTSSSDAGLPATSSNANGD